MVRRNRDSREAYLFAETQLMMVTESVQTTPTSSEELNVVVCCGTKGTNKVKWYELEMRNNSTQYLLLIQGSVGVC